jgi:hypothetical protein
MRKKAMPNSVNRPSASGPTMTRRTARNSTNTIDSREITIPEKENSCSGSTEKPVTRSKLSRINR